MPIVFVVVLHFSAASIAVAPMEYPTGYATKRACENAIGDVVARWRLLTAPITAMPAPDGATCEPLRIR